MLKYFIKDLGIGHGVFVKQETPTVSIPCDDIQFDRF